MMPTSAEASPRGTFGARRAVWGFAARWAALRPRVLAGEMSRRAAARMLGVSEGTLRRLLAGEQAGAGVPVPA